MFVDFNYQPVIEDFNKDGTLKLEAIVKIFENSGNAHSDIADDGNLNRTQNGIAWVLTDWKIQISEYPKYKDTLTARTWSQKATQVFNVSRDFELFSNGTCDAVATTRWVALDLGTQRLLKIEQPLIEKYCPEEKSVFAEAKLPKIPVPEQFENETEIKTRRSDIDFNGHVHNLTYIDYAMEALPPDVYSTRNFTQLRITYKNPVQSGETVWAKYARTGDSHVVCIYGASGELKTQILFG